MFLILIILLILQNFNYALSIKELVYLDYNALTITLSSYPHFIRERIVMDLSEPFCYFPESVFKQELVVITKDTKSSITIRNQTSILEYTTTELNFTQSNTILSNLNVICNPQNDFPLISSFIGLSYKNYTQGFSVLKLMKEQKLINKLKFGFVGNRKHEAENFFFDEVPNSFIKDLFKHTIKVNETKGEWGLDVKGIYFENEESDKRFNNIFYAYVNTINDRIFAPKKFMWHLINTDVFQKYVNYDACALISSFDSMYITCQCDSLNDFPALYLEINGYVFPLTKDDLFFSVHNVNTCLFLIQYNYIDACEQWMFGSKFLRKYITEFDAEKKEITFYSQNKLQKLSEPINISIMNIIKQLFTFHNLKLLSMFGNIIIMLIESIFLILFLVFKRNSVKLYDIPE